MPHGNEPKLVDLAYYRAALDAVAGGALMFDWLAYPPVTLILLSPLRGLPELAADQLWTGTSILMILVLAAALSKLALGLRSASEAKDPALFLAFFGVAGTLLMLSEPINNQLLTGQLTILIVTLAFVDAAGVLPRKWQGSLVGLGAAFKLTPLIFFPYYLVTRQWRQAGMATASFVAATGLGFVLFPRDSLAFWTHADTSADMGPGRIDNLSLLGVLSRWLADPSLVRALWYGAALVVGLAAFWRALQHLRRGEQVEAALVIGCASTVISPVAWPHYQIWLVLAASWLLIAGSRRTKIIGALIYVPYSALVVLPIFSRSFTDGDFPPTLGLRLLWEVLVLVPTLICFLGLPHRVGSTPSRPAADAAVADTAPTPPAEPAVANA
jgi:alpha-1,2-mannosyltransferase